MGTPEERLDYVEQNASTDLKFIMADAEIDEKVQYDLVNAGYKTLRRFVGMEDTRAGVRQFLRDSLGLDGGADLANNVKVATVIDAGEASTVWAKRQNELGPSLMQQGGQCQYSKMNGRR